VNSADRFWETHPGAIPIHIASKSHAAFFTSDLPLSKLDTIVTLSQKIVKGNRPHRSDRKK